MARGVELEATTRERYDDLIRLCILPTFGDLEAAKLDAELPERFYARLHRCRDLCSGEARAGHICCPLSSSTTRKVHHIAARCAHGASHRRRCR